MPAEHSESSEPRRLSWLNWKWLSLGLSITVLLILCVLQIRNQQQWSRVRKFQRSVEQAAGTCEVTARVGTDFWRLWKPDPGDLAYKVAWPTIAQVRLHPETRCDEIDWSLAPSVELHFLHVDAAEFTDAELARIPQETPLYSIDFFDSQITGRSLPVLLGFKKLGDVTTKGTQLDGQDLIQLLQQTKVIVHPFLTTKELVALGEKGLLPRVMTFELQADDDFSVAQLQGISDAWEGVFHGTYGEDGFQNADKQLYRPRIVITHARLHAKNLADIARMPSVSQILLDHVEIIGDPQPAPDNPPQESLKIAVRNSRIPAAHFKVFSGRPFALLVDDPNVDDAWLEQVMETAGLGQVLLANSQVSEATLDKFKIGSRPGKPYVTTAARLGTEWDAPRHARRLDQSP